MRRMSTGWEEWVQDEKDEYRIRRISTGWVQDEKDEYRMRKMSTEWKEWVLEEKKWK